MTIDEAIEFCNEKAINIKLKAEPKVFIQLAELLEELKELRATSCGYNKEDIELNRNAMYSKAIDDFVKMCDEVKICDIYDCVSLYDIEHIAEQLREQK